MLILALSPKTNLAFAQEPITFKVEPEDYYAQKKGEIFTVNITIDNVIADDRLVGVEFRLGYNDTLLEVVEVKEGPFFKEFNQTSTPPYTLFIYYLETGIWGSHILVGAMIYPNSTGQWPGPMPEGNGTIAQITFRAIYQPIEPLPPANCTLDLFNSTAVNDSKEKLTVEEIDGYYEIATALYPFPIYEYSPLMPTAGQRVMFDASASYDPDGSILWYYWEFEDGTKINTTETMVSHVFNASGWHDVKLTIKDVDNLTSTLTKTIEVGAPALIEITVESGELHFRGEICDFTILITHLGRQIETEKLQAFLYYNGTLYINLTENLETIETGLHRLLFNIPGNVSAGTYNLLVKTKAFGMEASAIESFYVSNTLESLKNTIDDISDNVMTILIPDIGVIKLNVTEINPIIKSVNSTTVEIDTTVGTLYADVSQLGDLIDEIRAMENTNQITLYAATILALIAIILAAWILYLTKRAQ